jgi:hypothetical protein
MGVAMSQKLTGQVIIDQLIRNMELGQFEMGYSILLPCIFNIYLHPDDQRRLAGVLDFIKEDAKRALTAHLTQLNAKPFRLGLKTKNSKQYKIAGKDWSLEFFPDGDGAVPVGDVEIHSELNELPQPGYQGVKTTLLNREASAGMDTRRGPDKIYAELRYEDDSGPQVYHMTKDEIVIGRGGDDLSVELALYTNDEISREHARLRRDPLTNQFWIADNSMNGTWVNGRRVAKDSEERVPDRAQIGLSETITLAFEARK